MADNTEFNEMSSTINENIPSDNDGDAITMVDFLEEEQKLEDDVNAVLGGSDDKNCTYSMGYMKRQALYSCLTCIPFSSTDQTLESTVNAGGVCLACSYSCHEGHELVELYTKRNFRCDCGNSRFLGKKCNLVPDKAAVNELNSYNKNFFGTYCTCNRPYPDPDEEDPSDQMIQCAICEDWYHGRHLEPAVPSFDFSEVICQQCVSKHSFLKYYSVSLARDKEKEEEDANDIDTFKHKREQHQEDTLGCYILLGELVLSEGALFMKSGWRDNLCRCSLCTKTYETEGVAYLLDEEDSVQAYEAKGLSPNGEEPTSQYEQGMKALSSLDRVNQIEAIEGYNNMKVQLKDYLQKFADNKKVVREEDIREFFSGMEARKKPRLDHLPHFCR